MKSRMALILGSSVLNGLFAGCGQKPAATSPGPRYSLFEPDTKLFTSNAARHKEVASLIEEATSSNATHDRAAIALAAADRSAAELTHTINAINTACDVVLNNLKNIDTIAFKGSTARVNGNEIQIALNLEQGSLEGTSRQLDLSIQGEGFFKIKIDDAIGSGVGYTRNGNFFVNNKGELVLGMGDGYKLIPVMNIPLGTTEISVGQDGRVEIIEAGKTTKTVIGQFKLTHFINPHSLTVAKGGIYSETAASGPSVEEIPGEGGTGMLVEGFLESSNVDLLRDRTRLRFLLEWKATLMRLLEK